MKNKLLLFLLLAMSSNVLAQQLTIRGTVTDQKGGYGIIGAHVMVEGTNNVVVTDINGSYSINVPEGDVSLMFSYLAYKSQTVALTSGQSVCNVVLEEDLTEIDEVVVVGYGVTKKKLVTGANLNVKGDDIAKQNTSTALEALKGVAPGLNITSNSGSPGSGTKVYIRGIGTIGSASPLYIVDGVAVSSIDNINPLSIESIDVLKDAASAAIYGSRAANGVILVTTKKGSKDTKTQVSYSGYYGFQNFSNTVSTLNAQEYMYIQDEMRLNEGLAANDWLTLLCQNSWLETQSAGASTAYGTEIWNKLQDGWEGTDWVDEITTDNATITSHSVNVTGGGSKSRYAFGLSYYDQQGVVGGDLIDAGYKRFNTTMNSDFVLLETKSGRPVITIGENLTYTHSVNRSVAEGGIYYNDVFNAIRTSPLMMAYWDESPNQMGFGPNLDGVSFSHSNPLAQLYYNRSNFTDNGSNSILGNVFLEVEPIKNLKFRSSYGLNTSFGSSRSYSPVYTGVGTYMQGNTTDSVSQGMWQYTSYTWTNTVSYDKDFDVHRLSFLVGNEVNATLVNSGVGGSRNNSYYSDLDHAYLSNTNTADSTGDISNYGYDYGAQGGGTLSYMGRASYSYDDKYMLDVTMRIDGSSNFSDGNKWGYFPSVAAGWNFTEEDFMSDFDFISFGKLRASWGQNGNQTLLSQWGSSVSFAYTSNITTSGLGYYFGDGKISGSTASYPSNIPNEDLTWETSEQLNFGLDLRFLDTRLGVTFDWYNKTTKDWLVQAAVLGTYGADAPYINGGTIVNKGVELSVSWNDRIGDFTYGVTASYFKNKNKVTELASATGYMTGEGGLVSSVSDYVSRVEVGMPIGYFYGYKTDGILQNQAEVDAYVNSDGNAYFSDSQAGDLRFVDVNGDGSITDDDKTMIGNPNAAFELGLQLNLGYKGAFLNITGSGKFGQQVFNTYFWGDPTSSNSYRNWTTEIFNRWTGEGTSTKIPRLSYSGDRNSSYISDAYVYDADFFRISNLTIGYDFSYLMSKEKWLSNVSLYLSISNLCTFTGYTGFDPDVAYGGDSSSWASGVDMGLYPLSRTVMVGLNFTL